MQTLLQSCFNLFLNFSFHYSLNKVPAFSGFLMCITMNLRNFNLFLNFSFRYSLNKVPAFSGFLMCITMNLRNGAFWQVTQLGSKSKLTWAINYLSLFFDECTSIHYHELNCLKSVRIRSYFGLYFPAFGLNTRDTEYLFVFSSNTENCGAE